MVGIIQSILIFNVSAQSLSENINNQLGNLDLSELEEFFNSVNQNNLSPEFSNYLHNLLNGEYGFDYKTFGEYIFKIFFNNIYEILPSFFSIIAIAIFCGIIQGAKSKYLSDGISEIISLVCLLSIILIISNDVILLWKNTQNTIDSIAKLCTIMSPIIITLMLASGGTVSATVYKPSVTFLSSGIINIVLYVVLPLVGITTIFGIISTFSRTLKLNKLSDFFTSLIKWIMGLICTVFGLFLSIQGITSATFDGISIKAAKYAISNSIPLIGGFLKDGFDLVVAGSILIKNAIGITCIFALFYMILSPILHMVAFSLLLKLTSALIQPICNTELSDFCTVISKGISYLIVCLLTVGFMMFLTVILMIFSANAFI